MGATCDENTPSSEPAIGSCQANILAANISMKDLTQPPTAFSQLLK